jgi:hypothetical protein
MSLTSFLIIVISVTVSAIGQVFLKIGVNSLSKSNTLEQFSGPLTTLGPTLTTPGVMAGLARLSTVMHHIPPGAASILQKCASTRCRTSLLPPAKSDAAHRAAQERRDILGVMFAAAAGISIP